MNNISAELKHFTSVQCLPPIIKKCKDFHKINDWYKSYQWKKSYHPQINIYRLNKALVQCCPKVESMEPWKNNLIVVEPKCFESESFVKSDNIYSATMYIF